MLEGIRPSILWIALASVSFAIAILAATGTILADDRTGRIIYGILWSAIGFSWLFRRRISRKPDGTAADSRDTGIDRSSGR